eukprot:1300-Heterococcus_DN1.PRE.2
MSLTDLGLAGCTEQSLRNDFCVDIAQERDCSTCAECQQRCECSSACWLTVLAVGLLQHSTDRHFRSQCKRSLCEPFLLQSAMRKALFLSLRLRILLDAVTVQNLSTIQLPCETLVDTVRQLFFKA